VEGVDMLQDGKTNNYVTVKQQLYDKLQADYGDIASFIETEERWYPEAPTMAGIAARYPDISVDNRDKLYVTKVLDHDRNIIKIDDTYSKMFGVIRQVLDAATRDKVERSPGYLQAKGDSDPCALWKIIARVVGMRVAAGDLSDARQTVKLLYQAERMGTSETLLTF